ncbi:sodium channel protein Nach-like [Ostrinia nubilalis]|uniref:sodium channel protein Nach-like n=1 Tax=Ostrinia nubilalis TaxID=29057 RepID=UPI0030822CC0
MRTVDPAVWSKYKAKSGVKLSWQQAESLEERLRRSLVDAFKEYVTHCTIKGVRFATDKDSPTAMRIIMLLLMIWGSSWVAFNCYRARVRPPLQINLQDSEGAPSVPFPAVGICSNCLVSEKALELYADELVAKDNNRSLSREDIKTYLKNFGAMITSSRPKNEDLQFLRFLYKIDNNFNITDLMYKLAPKCSSILKKCSWRGRLIDCQIMFAERATPLGFCCVFNSRYYPVDMNNGAKTLDRTGVNHGLLVVVKENPDDFAVIRRPTLIGLDVMVFDGDEYPLLESGAVRTYCAGINDSVYFKLEAHAQYVADSVEYFDEERRGCRISQSPRSSFAWCLTECRRAVTMAICNCVPFYLPRNATDIVCTTEHLQCLYKHREKMRYYYPGDMQDASLGEELQDSQSCPACEPDCARIYHSANAFHTLYYRSEKLFSNQFR